MRDIMIFYRSFYEAIKELPLETQGELYNALFSYGLDFIDSELKGISKTVWILIKPQIDANIRKYHNGKIEKTKQNVSKTEAKYKQEISKTEANVNDNVNDNVNVINKIDYQALLETLNTAFSRSFKLINKKVRSSYEARLKDGYSKDQIMDAINNCKINDYHKEKNYQYCTPEFFSRAETLDKYSNVTKQEKIVYAFHNIIYD
jgi:uncharacterized phage protein (TIGR02220 family)